METGFAVRRAVTVALDERSAAALTAWVDPGQPALGALLTEAVYYYLADADSGRGGWRYPPFRRHEASPDPSTKVSLSVDERAWHAFSDEAARQGVSVDRLLHHAA